MSRQKGPITHYGIAFGDGRVLEIVPGSTPRLVAIEKFADGKPIWIQRPTKEERPSILERALHVLQNPEEYRYLTNNCQHLKNFVLTSKSYSETVWRLACIALVTISIYAALRRG